MLLYEEIIFLENYFRGKYCVENVIGYYEPLVKPNIINNHYFWTNFIVRDFSGLSREHGGSIKDLQDRKGFDLSKYSGIDKRKTLRNCVEPELGKHILDLAINPIEINNKLF